MFTFESNAMRTSCDGRREKNSNAPENRVVVGFFILIKIDFEKRAKYLNVNALCATSRPGQNNSSYSSFLLNRLPNARTDNNNGWNYVDKTMKTHKKRQNFELKSIDKRQTTQLKSHMCHCPCQTLFIQSKAVACPRDDAHRCRMYKTPFSIAFLC